MHVVDGVSSVEPLNPLPHTDPSDPSSQVDSDAESINNTDNNDWTHQIFNRTLGRFITFYSNDYG